MRNFAVVIGILFLVLVELCIFTPADEIMQQNEEKQHFLENR